MGEIEKDSSRKRWIFREILGLNLTPIQAHKKGTIQSQEIKLSHIKHTLTSSTRNL